MSLKSKILLSCVIVLSLIFVVGSCFNFDNRRSFKEPWLAYPDVGSKWGDARQLNASEFLLLEGEDSRNYAKQLEFVEFVEISRERAGKLFLKDGSAARSGVFFVVRALRDSVSNGSFELRQDGRNLYVCYGSIGRGGDLKRAVLLVYLEHPPIKVFPFVKGAI